MNDQTLAHVTVTASDAVIAARMKEVRMASNRTNEDKEIAVSRWDN
jgi:hypothetical protein